MKLQIFNFKQLKEAQKLTKNYRVSITEKGQVKLSKNIVKQMEFKDSTLLKLAIDEDDKEPHFYIIENHGRLDDESISVKINKSGGIEFVCLGALEKFGFKSEERKSYLSKLAIVDEVKYLKVFKD
jgi:hypothetical protein